ncbi:uncharacterized protein F5Z01DRAFT_669185 [Emericellopsis atlantica]|uniref:Uncharacterized protein n=1 Tax=Emericellopsis atlantica TaxID=2614577 RepID=A0A9P7ZCT0_9HYPO|nr:uncharacterized protein F5Z01DRAFT_669185 [Emericellopsis atlantica]KAG9249442.1 hypothetical protein F5Z01DRAFT_669185 [Emericellopsis atlantica]
MRNLSAQGPVMWLLGRVSAGSNESGMVCSIQGELRFVVTRAYGYQHQAAGGPSTGNCGIPMGCVHGCGARTRLRTSGAHSAPRLAARQYLIAGARLPSRGGLSTSACTHRHTTHHHHTGGLQRRHAHVDARRQSNNVPAASVTNSENSCDYVPPQATQRKRAIWPVGLPGPGVVKFLTLGRFTRIALLVRRQREGNASPGLSRRPGVYPRSSLLYWHAFNHSNGGI